MRRRVKEKDGGVVRGVYYYRGRYWSALAWSKLNRPTDAADASLSMNGRGKAVSEAEETPKGDSPQTGQPVTAVGR